VLPKGAALNVLLGTVTRTALESMRDWMPAKVPAAGWCRTWAAYRWEPQRRAKKDRLQSQRGCSNACARRSKKRQRYGTRRAAGFRKRRPLLSAAGDATPAGAYANVTKQLAPAWCFGATRVPGPAGLPEEKSRRRVRRDCCYLGAPIQEVGFRDAPPAKAGDLGNQDRRGRDQRCLEPTAPSGLPVLAVRWDCLADVYP